MRSETTLPDTRFLRDLNPQQREAVQTLDGPVLLLAGAGTGKTRVVTCRVAHLIAIGVSPASILAVTFTNKAAREMRERVNTLVPPAAAAAVTIGTFHSVCSRLLRQHIRKLGYSPRFSISGDAYQLGLIRTIMAELGYIGDGRDPRAWLSAISKAKCALRSPDDLRTDNDTRAVAELADVYELYARRMQQMDLLDFDDLLVLVQRLWEERPEILAEHRERFRYLLVDEYQDTNHIQFKIVADLAGERANICVVGDDDQSIYGWRGAEVANILQFESRFPGTRVIRLEQNYRSTSTILEAANQLISHNNARHAKALWCAREKGKEILAVRTRNEAAEAAFVTDLVRERNLEHDRGFSEFAVLFRSNHQSRLFESHFRQARVPYTVVGVRSFYKRREILDAVSLLRCLENVRDDLSLLRILSVPPRGVGDRSVERLKAWQRKTTLPLQELIRDEDVLADLPGEARSGLRQLSACLLEHREAFAEAGGFGAKVGAFLQGCGYMPGLGRMYKPRADALARLENLHEFIAEASEFAARAGPAAALGSFLESLALLDANDEPDTHTGEGPGAVTLTTVHAAKGLEFPVVVIAGLERGLFPHRRSLEERTEEEERRLFYVALTRAKEEVVLTYVARRKVEGQLRNRRPSPFLDEIPQHLVSYKSAENAFEPAPPEIATSYLEQMKAMFAPAETAPE